MFEWAGISSVLTDRATAANLDVAESPEWRAQGCDRGRELANDHNLGRITGNELGSHFYKY